MEEKKKIIIIGGGLGGLILANSLLKHGDEHLKVEVYERDAGPISRNQGYIIGLNPVGLESIEKAVYEDKYKRFQQLFKPGQFSIFDRNLNLLLQLENGSSVNRRDLRNILMEGVDMHFGKKLVSYEENDESVTATFEDGTSVTGDILVAADGVRSAVRRKKIPDFKYEDVNVFKIQVLIPNVPKDVINIIFPNETNEIVKSLGNNKNTIIFGRTMNVEHAISLGIENVEDMEAWEQKREDVEMVFVVYEYRPTPNSKLPEGKSEMLEHIRRDTKTFHPMVQKLFNEIALPDHILETSNPIQLTQAAPFPKYNTSRVTFLGDSVHCMTSHAGQGGNMAMKDGYELSMAIIDIYGKGKPLIETLGSYEKVMLDRGFKAVNLSRSNTERMHANEVGYIGESIRNTMFRIFFKLISWGIIKPPS